MASGRYALGRGCYSQQVKFGELTFTVVGDYPGLSHFTLSMTLGERYAIHFTGATLRPQSYGLQSLMDARSSLTMKQSIQPHVLRVDGGLNPPHLPSPTPPPLNEILRSLQHPTSQQASCFPPTLEGSQLPSPSFGSSDH